MLADLLFQDLFLPGFWSALKSSRLGIKLALKLVSTCFGSYVPGARRQQRLSLTIFTIVVPFQFLTILAFDQV